ncbi:DNA-binding response regulator [Corynebacterium striatum]|nr:DNA-binding response regulator [Corynebacterium striatum]
MTTDSSAFIWTLIVDDDPLVLSLLREYFTATEDIRVAEEARDGIEALSLLDKIYVDIVLADINMPKMDGLTLLHEVQNRPNPPLFIATTDLDTDDAMLDVLARGGAGYIIKSAQPQAIIHAIRDAVAGGTTVSPPALKRLVRYLFNNPKTPYPLHKKEQCSSPLPLTNREKEILHHLCEGKSNAEIAESMNYSESAIKKQLSRIMSLFNVDTRLRLVVKVFHSVYTDH